MSFGKVIQINLPRRDDGVREDVRKGEREPVFSKWHRDHCGQGSYVTDVDFLEYRFENNELKLKAVLETKEWHVRQSKYIEESANFKAIKKLCKEAEIPFYHVWHKNNSNGEIDKFEVWKVFEEPKDDMTEMKPEVFKNFIDDL